MLQRSRAIGTAAAANAELEAQVMARLAELYSYSLCSYGLYSYGPDRYGLYGYGLYIYSYGLGYRQTQPLRRALRAQRCGHDLVPTHTTDTAHYKVMAYVVMAYVVMAYVVMAYIVMAI